tara:strand:- start:685 stop:993 length:309 start_codon:yes stop_codon:yes gene_type:complete
LDRDGVGDVSDNKPLTIPKGFSPNGDGVNDEFIIAGLHKFKNNALEVFNRYGHSVHQQSNYQNYWDGIANKKEKILPAGPYYYALTTGNLQQVVKGWGYINY